MAKQKDRTFAGAFAMPPSAPKDKKAKEKPLGDVPLLSTAFTAKPERPPSARVLKNGMREYPADKHLSMANLVYIHDKVGKSSKKGRELKRQSQALFDFVASDLFAKGSFESLARRTDWAKKVEAMKLPQKVDTPAAARRWVDAIKTWALRNTAQYSTVALSSLSSLLLWCNQQGVHPLDVADWFFWFNSNTKGGAKGGGLAGPSTMDTMSSFFSTMKANRFSINKDVAAVVQSFLKLKGADFPAAFTTLANAKPWGVKVPSSGDCLGMEVTQINYLVPTAFDREGNPSDYKLVGHKTSAFELAGKASDPREARALISQSPAGRLYLCFSKDMKSVFFATSFKPKRPLFSTGEEYLDLAAAFNDERYLQAVGLVV